MRQAYFINQLEIVDCLPEFYASAEKAGRLEIEDFKFQNSKFKFT